MGKMQPVSFSSIEDFLEYLPEDQRKVVDALRIIVKSCMPQHTEKLAYNVPFYYVHTRVCYIWPAAVPWGKVPLEGIQLGFINGHLMRDDINYLDKGNRKQVFTKTFFKVEDIDVDLLKAYIFEALEVDERLYQTKKAPGKS